MAGAAGDSVRRWRDKYLDLVDSHEKLKHNSEEQQDQLRRALVMVSLLAEGQESSVDSALARLRETLKPGAVGMEKTMSDLERAVRRFEDQNTARAEVLLGELSDVAHKLADCPLPKPLQKRVREVRKTAQTELQSWAGYINQLQAWMQILGDLATLDGYDEQPSKWWQRWFSPRQQSTETPETEAAEHKAQPIQLDQPIEQTEIEGEPGFSHISDEVSQTLLSLLSQLVIPERLNTSANELQGRLSKGLNWYELVPLLEDTAEFLIDCLGSGQQEFERFLANLDERLRAIQLLVSDAHSGQEERKRAREDLDGLVRDQIADIRSVVTGSRDLGELGSSVREHLTLIVRAMEKYQEDEQEREQRLSAKLEMLQNRLTEMEKEASAARKVIEEQKRRATHDVLTGLPNREAYGLRLEQELKRRSRYGGALTMAIGDVDHFKSINDNFGHLAGDKVLQLLARAMRKYLRDVDFIARYGGEEFVMLMPETTAEEAMVATEKLRTTIEKAPFHFKQQPVQITMSFGIAEFHALEDPETVFDRADKALYKAKAEGRNRSQLAAD
ncbi:hypothetical protein CHH28_04965 [Bacterioplanes sanyensis]|uniref:diguanylate cyclase n=1 Tax=Bacterioplanes sanyensis TaxID=1249553 RepID=A0A222FH39_9GAMM|nr:GGDEF domain-containing protein [Bacterioplanes sanyensis]ASP38070.1 hypothetical protein CHH28_04965 [Bacterioplanes sanyensis]